MNYKLYFIWFIKIAFILNPTEQAIRHLLARIVIGHFKYFYALSELTQIFSLVQQSEPHKTRSSFHVCFKT